MNNLNSVLLEGNLTRDPVLNETTKGTPVCVFGLAVNRYYRQEENTVKEVSFFEVEAWSRLAQYAGSMLKKGAPVRVVGHLKQDRWDDAEGKSRSRIKVVAEHLEVTERKGTRDGDAPAGHDTHDAESPAGPPVEAEKEVILI